MARRAAAQAKQATPIGPIGGGCDATTADTRAGPLPTPVRRRDGPQPRLLSPP
jgi:hypothetical protein